MSILFDRRVSVTVAEITGVARTWSDLRISFNCEHTKRSEPNRGQISIYGLNEDSRNWIRDEGAKVFVNAGYEELHANVFVGDIRRASTTFQSPEVVTKIEAGDGERAYVDATVNITLGPGRTVADAVRAIRESMGVPYGFVDPGIDMTEPFMTGISMSGKAVHYLEYLSEQVGAEWSLEDGTLKLVLADSPTNSIALLLNPDNLIGSPEPILRRQKRRTTVAGLFIQTLLHPALRPGRVVRLESRAHRGTYLCEKVTHQGDSGFQNDFYTEIEAKQIDV